MPACAAQTWTWHTSSFPAHNHVRARTVQPSPASLALGAAAGRSTHHRELVGWCDRDRRFLRSKTAKPQPSLVWPRSGCRLNATQRCLEAAERLTANACEMKLVRLEECGVVSLRGHAPRIPHYDREKGTPLFPGTAAAMAYGQNQLVDRVRVGSQPEVQVAEPHLSALRLPLRRSEGRKAQRSRQKAPQADAPCVRQCRAFRAEHGPLTKSV